MNKKRIIVTALTLFMGFSSCEDNNTTELRSLDRLTRIEVENSIEKTVGRIESAGQKGSYDVLDILLEHCTSPHDKIRMAAGLAVEEVTDKDFGFSKETELARSEALIKALSWWKINRKKLIQDIIFKKLKPYLMMEFDGNKVAKTDERFKISVRDYLLRSQVSEDVKQQKTVSDIFYAMQVMSDFGQDAWAEFEKILANDNESQLLKEKIVYILEGQEPLSLKTGKPLLKPYISDIVKNCSHPEKKCGLYRVWGQFDADSAAKSLWAEFNQSKGNTRDLYLKTLYTLDSQGVSDLLVKELKTGNRSVKINAMSLMGKFGLSQHINLMIDSLVAADTNIITYREAFASACLLLGVRRTIDELRARVLSTDTNEEHRQIYFNSMELFQGFMDEYKDKIKLIKSENPQAVLAGARLSQTGEGTKTSALMLINALEFVKDKRTEKEIFKALNYITGHEFGIDEREYRAFAQREDGSDEEKRRRFTYLKAKIWWSDHKNQKQKQWIVNAFRKEKFFNIEIDKHVLNQNERRLMEMYIELDPEYALKYCERIYNTNKLQNKEFVLNLLREKKIPGRAEFLMPRINNRDNSVNPSVAILFCQLASYRHHRQVMELLKAKDRNVVEEAAESIVRTSGFRQIGDLINIVENGDAAEAELANNILKRVSQNDFGDIRYITKPERKFVVKSWKNWWQVVYENSEPGAWQHREITRLVVQLNPQNNERGVTATINPAYWRRLDQLTHYKNGFVDYDDLKRFWNKHGDMWSINSRYVIDLMSNNWWRAERAQVVLLAHATHNDVSHMVHLLDHQQKHLNDLILPVLRVLTGLDFGYHSDLSLDERRVKITNWKVAWLNEPIPYLNHVIVR